MPEPSESRVAEPAAPVGPASGWIFYDARCRRCRGGARCFRAALARRGYHLAPLQRGWVQERLGVDPIAALAEMRVLTSTGRVLAGADAILHVARSFWWAAPLRVLASVPGGASLLRAVYRLVAAHRHDRCAPETPP